jgi:hypothetical protein
MTVEQVENLKLGIMPIDDRVVLIVESAIDWINRNTTLNIDCNNDDDLSKLQPCVKLFICGFFDVATINVGVTSESIEGLSQSFNTADKNLMIWDLANTYLSDYLNNVRFVMAKNRWN